jgi:transcriptional regulator with XRE-family HTH domain
VKVGLTIRRLREAQALTQAALARQAGIGRITLVRIEGGTQDPTLNTLKRIARALGLRMRDLLPAEGGRRWRP